MPSFFRRSVLAAAFALPVVAISLAPAAFAQTQSINGSLRGTVTDATGAPIPGASVVIRNVDTGYTRSITADDAGLYLAPALPIGTYSVAATFKGFAPLTQTGIHLSAGTELTVNESLKTGSVATQVEVTSDAPILETSRLDLGRTISAAETQNLPLTSRNPYNFILFQPGVSGHPNPENGIPRTLDTNGLVDRVNFQLDGMVDTETDRYGLRLFAISDSYTKEINTISNSYAPEFGNTAGIIYNVITNSGTNKFHGLAQYIWRPKAASSCPILQNCGNPATPKPSLHVDDFVGNVGGPVIRDKFFFFVAYEHLKRANPTANTISAVTQSALESAGVSPSDFNTAGQVQYAQWFDVRGDYNINKKNQFFARYNYFRNRYPFNTNVGGTYALSAAADFQDRAHIIGAQLITTFSPTLLNEFRGSWPYRNEHHVADPLTGPGPMITIAAFTDPNTHIAYTAANFGGSNATGDKFQEKIPSFNDNVTWIKGAHSVKFGFGFQKNNDDQLADVYTQYTFAKISDYVNAKNGTSPQVYSSLKASIGQPGAAYHSVFFDWFIQDTWQVSKKMIASYGVRYDQYRAPTPPAGEPFVYTQSFRTPTGNYAPRVGIAYTVTPTTVIRLNAGMFYEATPTNTWYNPLYNNGAYGAGNFIASIAGSATPGTCQPAFPSTPSTLIASCPTPAQSIYALNPKFKNEYTWNANLQVQQQLAKNDSLTLGYTLTNGRNMQFLRNLNLINPTSFLADGRPVYSTTASATTRLYPSVQSNGQTVNLNNITYEDIGSNSSYNALTATYDHRMSAGLSSSISYTWSHAISNTPEGNTYEFSNPVEDPSNPLRDRGNSGINRPNSLTASVVYQPNTHFENKYLNGAVTGNNFAFLANMSSGDQQNETTSTVLNGDSLASSRPLFIGRNSIRGPSIYQYDMRYTRTLGTYWDRVSPKLLIEGNNIFNHSNVTSINTTAAVFSCYAATPTTGCPNPAPTAAGIGQITPTGSPNLLPTSTLLEARILQFGLKIDF